MSSLANADTVISVNVHGGFLGGQQISDGPARASELVRARFPLNLNFCGGEVGSAIEMIVGRSQCGW